jgi:hypothetical protein
MRRVLIAATTAVALMAGSASAATGCPAGLRPATTAEVFFGQDIAGGAEVSDADWRGFLSAEVSPRFPDGLTVADVYGQWRGPKGSFVKEPSKALFIVLAHRGDDQRRLALVRDAYKRQFRQDSVLLVEQRACVSF